MPCEGPARDVCDGARGVELTSVSPGVASVEADGLRHGQLRKHLRALPAQPGRRGRRVAHSSASCAGASSRCRRGGGGVARPSPLAMPRMRGLRGAGAGLAAAIFCCCLSSKSAVVGRVGMRTVSFGSAGSDVLPISSTPPHTAGGNGLLLATRSSSTSTTGVGGRP